MSDSRRVLEAKLSAALLALGHIPHAHAKKMTDDQVISLYQFDHYPIRKEAGGPYVGWNLQPLLIGAHREKTAKVDAPAIAKDRDLRDKALLHDAALARKSGDEVAAAMFLEQVRPSRRRQKATIRSQGFNRRFTKKFDGRVVPRKERRSRRP